MPVLDQIWVFPIKSLDGLSLSAAQILAGGALAQDREFALFNQRGQVINGKRTPLVHQLQATYDLAQRTVSLSRRDRGLSSGLPVETFHLDHDRSPLERWLSDWFGEEITLKRDHHQGFPDDTQSPGPTVISTATLEAIAAWFPGLSLDQARQRFRTNLELRDCPAFWEDRLFAAAGVVSFRLGEVSVQGVNPCQRCVVPSRDPQWGDRIEQFQAKFVSARQASLPDWAAASRFNHFYRVAINTRIPATEAGKTLRLHDPIALEFD